MSERELDVRGQKCPMPIVMARKELAGLGPGEVLKVLATDRGSVLDFQGWIRKNPAYELLSQIEEAGADGQPVFVHRLARKA